MGRFAALRDCAGNAVQHSAVDNRKRVEQGIDCLLERTSTELLEFQSRTGTAAGNSIKALVRLRIQLGRKSANHLVEFSPGKGRQSQHAATGTHGRQ